MEKDLDNLISKLQVVEDAEDGALKGKADSKATAKELKRQFTTNKALIEQA